MIGKRMTAPKAFPRVALDLATTVERIQQNFVICDPNLPDCPIVFASDGFIELTEYPRHEILGRNCRYAVQPCHEVIGCLHADVSCVQTMCKDIMLSLPLLDHAQRNKSTACMHQAR